MIHTIHGGFSNQHPARECEQNIVADLWKSHHGNVEHGVIFNLTHHDLDFKLQQLDSILDSNPIQHVMFYSMVDDLPESQWRNTWLPLLNKLSNSGITVSGYGYFNHYFPNSRYVDFWALFAEKHIQCPDMGSKPTHVSDLFLCYNRKPRPPRVELYNQFNRYDLLQHGTYTLGKHIPFGVNHNANHAVVIKDTLEDYADRLPVDEIDPEGTGIPNDIVSVGDIDTWAKSLFVIVNETTTTINVQYPFISEKTWKPIIGKKPFFVLGDNATVEVLQAHGFYTFEKHFGFQPNRVEDLIEFLNSAKNQDYEKLWLSLQPMVEHNYKNFYRYTALIKQSLGLTLSNYNQDTRT